MATMTDNTNTDLSRLKTKFISRLKTAKLMIKSTESDSQEMP